jgi:hypothetical protein
MIVIPFAGLSQRFKDAGYQKPKYMLDLDGITVFEKSVMSFQNFFSSEEFIFIGLDLGNTYFFVNDCASRLGIKNFKIVLLKNATKGQAETVYLGLKSLNFNQPTKLIIFNIDTFRLNFTLLPIEKTFDGYLEVFEGSGLNWSYVLPQFENKILVECTAEKEIISNLCCSGLYVFSNHLDFFEAFEHYSKNNIFVKGEIYIAPLYNYLISKLNKSITYSVIDKSDVIFCGVPSEYEELRLNISSNKN